MRFLSASKHSFLIGIILFSFSSGCAPKRADGSYLGNYTYHPYLKKDQKTYIKNESKDSFFIPSKKLYQTKISGIKMKQISRTRIENLAKSQLGKHYRWGANGPYDFDCSGFTKFIYAQNGVTLPRVSREQAKVGKFVDWFHLRKGDLIFFDSSKSSKVSHTGIYLGDNHFIHASSSKKKVVISNINERYYRKHFKWGRRLIK